MRHFASRPPVPRPALDIFLPAPSIYPAAVRLIGEHLSSMQYAMLVYFNEADFFALPQSEQDRLRNECADWQDRLHAAGQCGDCMRLQPAATATTLREKNGKLVLVDGPFAETKEILGGLGVLEARDLDGAIALARTFPSLPAGFSLELRPVMPNGTRRTDAP